MRQREGSRMNYATWIRRHGFILGLILAVVLAIDLTEDAEKRSAND